MEALLERANKIKIPTTEVVQRLHPDWRMVPHLEIFGWTEKHQQLEEYLQNQENSEYTPFRDINFRIKHKKIFDIYFSSEYEYFEVDYRLKRKSIECPGRPIVNTVDGIIEILDKFAKDIRTPPYELANVLGR
ncbi:hypothetical protein PGB90_002665 [Kerria lacca]